MILVTPDFAAPVYFLRCFAGFVLFVILVFLALWFYDLYQRRIHNHYRHDKKRRD